MNVRTICGSQFPLSIMCVAGIELRSDFDPYLLLPEPSFLQLLQLGCRGLRAVPACGPGLGKNPHGIRLFRLIMDQCDLQKCLGMAVSGRVGKQRLRLYKSNELGSIPGAHVKVGETVDPTVLTSDLHPCPMVQVHTYTSYIHSLRWSCTTWGGDKFL